MRLMPTSITTTPSRTMSALMNRGEPIAATRISARRVWAERSRVPLCTTVTVAFAPFAFCMRSAARGFPTMLLRPAMTTSFPPGSWPERRRSSTTPAGVAGAKRGRPIRTSPTFVGWKQSTSFRGSTAATARSTRICGGSGCCTRMPWTFGSEFSFAISPSRRASETVSGSSIVQCASPISSEALPFIFTYNFEPGSSPTMIAASPGTTLRAASEAIRGISSRRTSSAIFFPSISSPGTDPPEIRDVEPAADAKHLREIEKEAWLQVVVTPSEQGKRLYERLELEPRPEKRQTSEVLDPQKIEILHFLQDHPDASVNEIVEEMGFSEYTVVNCLRVLTAVRLVTKQRGPALRRGVPPYVYRTTAHGEDLAGRFPAEATA